MANARRGKFDIVLVWACDRLARSTKHFLETLDELSRLKIEFGRFREQLDTGGALGRAVATIISVVAELERSLIVERVKAGIAPCPTGRTTDRTSSACCRSCCTAPRPSSWSETHPAGESVRDLEGQRLPHNKGYKQPCLTGVPASRFHQH